MENLKNLNTVEWPLAEEWVKQLKVENLSELSNVR
jgi:hypothetical protein